MRARARPRLVFGSIALVALPYASAISQEDAVELETLHVTGQVQATEHKTLLQSTAVLSGEELRVKTGATIGETLGNELGVNNSSFGPSVGLPVLRGLTGSRVRVMQDGIASHDASSVSPDHATTVESALAEQITIIRGPATLMYGSGASGGVVNVIDNRIPASMSPHLSGEFEPRFATNARRRALSARIENGVGPIAIHVDGFLREQENVSIPGEAIDEDAVAAQFGLVNRRNSSGFIPNTDARAQGGSVGASWIGEWGFVGAAINGLENSYGLPPAGSSEPPGPAGDVHGGDVRVEIEQTRFDFKSQFDSPIEDIESVSIRAGYVDYGHIEIEAGSPGTRFINRALEGRLELKPTPLSLGGGELTGTWGAQIVEREFSAIGAEAFVPRSDISAIGAFAVQSWSAGRWTVEFGARAERQRVVQLEPVRINGFLVTRTPIEHTSYSASAAVSATIDRASKISFSVSRALRAPDVQELLALGPHFSTFTFDRGNSKLEAEKFVNFDLGFEVQTTYADIGVNLFYNQVEDFIFQRNTGFFYDAEDGQFRVQCVRLDLCLPVTNYTQEHAELKGFEAQVELPVRETDYGSVYVRLFSDYVRGTLVETNNDIPRMPPWRYGAELQLHSPHWRGDLKLTRVANQTRPGENETATKGYTLLNASLTHSLVKSHDEEWTLFVRGTNLLDQEIRNAVSFRRNFSPEPGRSVEFGLRARF